MNQNKKENLQQQLLSWAERVVSVYNPIAKAEQVNYYTQSNLSLIKSSPDLLLLGINPGDGGGEGKQLTAQEFLLGNKDYSTKDSWKLWKDLCKIFSYGDMVSMLQNDETFVWSNVFHFNSKNEKALIKTMKAPEMIELSRDLIRVLNPKRVLCLGGTNCLYQLFPRRETSLITLIPGALWYTNLGSIPIYGITHTSSCYTEEKKRMLGKVLALLFDSPETEHSAVTIESKFGKELSAYKERLKGSREKMFLQEIREIVIKNIDLDLSDNKKLIYLNEYLQARIADTRDHSLNISYRKKYAKIYPRREKVVAFLEQRTAWNGKKYIPFAESEVLENISRLQLDADIKTYMGKDNGTDADKFAELITQELEDLSMELNKILGD